MKILYSYKLSFISVLILFLSIILISSCGTTKSIFYTQVDDKNIPDVIIMNDNSKYIIHSSFVKCKVSGDSLIVYNIQNMRTLEIIPVSEIIEIIVKSDIKRDSPARTIWNILSEIFLFII